MTGFELRTSDTRSDRSTNWVTTTALKAWLLYLAKLNELYLFWKEEEEWSIIFGIFYGTVFPRTFSRSVSQPPWIRLQRYVFDCVFYVYTCLYLLPFLCVYVHLYVHASNSMCIIPFLCVYFHLYVFTAKYVYTYYHFYVYTSMSMCILACQCVY